MGTHPTTISAVKLKPADFFKAAVLASEGSPNQDEFYANDNWPYRDYSCACLFGHLAHAVVRRRRLNRQLMNDFNLDDIQIAFEAAGLDEDVDKLTKANDSKRLRNLKEWQVKTLNKLGAKLLIVQS